MENEHIKPDYIFETSWEICNKVGGIHTVISTKALTLLKEYKDNLILIGPDVWRESHANPEFIEDKNLFKAWRKRLYEDGIKVKIGRWNIVGKPVVFLVDFSPYFPKKDEVFKEYWEKYKLDSLSGQWDYIEPAIFGYAAGRIIENFYRYYLTVRDKTVAHFHEWMTGTGILYLKDHVPQIATLFTTHATTVGRSIAGNGQPLYQELQKFNGDAKAREFNIVSKQSLEKTSAHQADCFTTVSEITSKECEQFHEKPVDVVTPNGFEDNFVPKGDDFDEKRAKARKKLREVAEAVLGETLDDDVKYIVTSGRYEFWNKGVDMFIDALAKVNKREKFSKDIVAYIMVPANNYGPRKDLLERLNDDITENTPISDNPFLTHYLHDADYDPSLQLINKLQITNREKNKVRVIFVPSYLNGDDGIFNMPYYDLLIGMDLTIFASYYEPWGYTPLESLAFHVPTITTTLAGFGAWIQKHLTDVSECIAVVERNDSNYDKAVEDIANRIIYCAYKSEDEIKTARDNSYFVSRTALWKNLIQYYYQAYAIALRKAMERSDSFIYEPNIESTLSTYSVSKVNKPNWRTINVNPSLPETFKGLDEIAKNFWWSWNNEAQELFEEINPKIWTRSDNNPVKLLKEVSFERYMELEKDKKFLAKYKQVYKTFKDYINTEKCKDCPGIAYFSMEYGIANALKIYSGGLGILAGDYLKQASDSNIDMVAVGFLYKFGYFTQQLTVNGEQLVSYEAQNFADLPIEPVKDDDGEQVRVSVAMPGRTVRARIWKAQVGRIPLYLLDTDFERNQPEDRAISHHLYGGNNENRLKQEIFLGIGGIRALNALGIRKNVYHINEGHAAFIGIERLREFVMEKKLTFTESLEIVRASSLFTTHTPVPAGHDAFPEDMVMTYMGHYPERLKITWEEFMRLGKLNPDDKNERYSMSNLAANLSQEINGVSKLHGEVTKKMFNKIWEGYYPEELHIGYVTNGVHYPSWTAKIWRQLYCRYFGDDFESNQDKRELWNRIYEVPNEEIWQNRTELRGELVDLVYSRLDSERLRRREDPKNLMAVRNNLKKDVLTIGFARRFASYKRAFLLFNDIDRLNRIINNPECPVQLVFAGKAHPADIEGQDLIKRIIEISRRPEFIGRLLFLENYDIELAKKLVHGVDVWLNTPTRPLEASGTSGMKAVLNGVLNFSVLDGWWVEGYRKGAGWALSEQRAYDNQDYQNELDAEMIYGMIENEIAPTFYEQNDKGVPEKWVQMIKKNIAEIAPEFTSKRMLDDYLERFYLKLDKRSQDVRANDYQMAFKIASWKKRMANSWDGIELISVKTPDTSKSPLMIGESYDGEVVVDLKDISPEFIGLELVIVDEDAEQGSQIISKQEMKLKHVDGKVAYFELVMTPTKPGNYHYGLRLFPKNELLAHRQVFNYVRWL